MNAPPLPSVIFGGGAISARDLPHRYSPDSASKYGTFGQVEAWSVAEQRVWGVRAALSRLPPRDGHQLGRLRVRRSTSVANGKTMSVPISAPSTPPQSKMLVSPIPRPTVKMR